MRTSYRMTLSDGSRIVIESRSAAEAIEQARRAHRGRTVVSCYSGMTQQDCDDLRRIDSQATPRAGIITHDVPPHEPIGEDEVFPVARRRSDNTVAMFDDEEIRAASDYAKGRAAIP
jgi:hypothetical protein